MEGNKGFSGPGITIKDAKRKYKRSLIELIQTYAPLLPPGSDPPLPILTDEEKKSVRIVDCKYEFEFCIGTGGTLAVGLSCGPGSVTLEFSADGKVNLSASKDNMGQTIFVAGVFKDVKTNANLVTQLHLSKADSARADKPDSVISLNPEQFISQFNLHYNSTTCPIVAADFCVTPKDPSIGFTFECNGASTSVKLDGKLTVSVSGNNGISPLIEIGND
jgi:hypothetical protein